MTDVPRVATGSGRSLALQAGFAAVSGPQCPGHARGVVGDAKAARAIEHNDSSVATHSILEVIHGFGGNPLRQIPRRDPVGGIGMQVGPRANLIVSAPGLTVVPRTK